MGHNRTLAGLRLARHSREVQADQAREGTDGRSQRGSGEPRRRAAVSGAGTGWLAVTVEGFEVLVGRGARENDELTFRVAEPRDFWLHVAGSPGSHVVVRNASGLAELPRDVARRAAELAAWHSKARNVKGKVEVHLCRVSDVSKPRGSSPGEVQLRTWQSLRVYPRGVAET